MNRNVILFGANGRIGREILTRLSRRLRPESIKIIPWRGEAEYWNRLDSVKLGLKLQMHLKPGGPVSVIFGGSLTDPKADVGALVESNLEFPRRCISALADQRQVHFFTLGSAFEGDIGLIGSNGYLKAKRDLFLWLENLQDQPLFRGRIHHTRLHTVYGPPFDSQMFVDQMARAIKSRREFCMTFGQQIREFHSAEDVAENMLAWVLDPDKFVDWLQYMSAGHAIKLADLAQHVFSVLDCPELLKIGALPSPESDNFVRLWPANISYTCFYRSALTGVTKAIDEFIGNV